ncbi:ATP-dependent DNA ligase [soil metagenome]
MRVLAEALERVRSLRGRNDKIRALADALRTIADDGGSEALEIATRLAVGRTLPVHDARTLGVGWRLVIDVAIELTGWDVTTIGVSSRVTGDLGEAFGLLVRRDPRAASRAGLSMSAVGEAFSEIAAASGRDRKRDAMLALFAEATWLETKYLAKALLGALRTGAMGGVLEAAIVQAFAAPAEAVRRALALVSDPGEVAVLAFEERLGDAKLVPGRPLDFMLASPAESVKDPIDWNLTIVEDKLDGVRAQIHARGAETAIFGRGLDRATAQFPEIARAFASAPFAVLDGEIVAAADGGRARPFQVLQERLNQKAPSRALLARTPVAFIAYDLLAEGDQVLLDLPLTARREKLLAYREACALVGIPASYFRVNEAIRLASDTELDAAFDAARARGNEGLVLKREDAPYDAGKRGHAWRKVKKAFATLDVVVTAAEEGHGKRAGLLSDYTFAVWSEDKLVNVGKAYSGVTDEEIDFLTTHFRAVTIEKKGPVRLVEPTIVLEVGFDGIQRSKRHASGFSLRFPRIMRLRRDKTADDANTVTDVEALYGAQLESGHREEAVMIPDGPKKKQLSLFGDD